MKTKKNHNPGQRQFVRIIGGDWRSRHLAFSGDGNIRPTPDRVRETLFNWLGQTLHGQHILDLFCGSGILGLEALSRGAASATLIDSNAQAIDKIREQAHILGAGDRLTCHACALPAPQLSLAEHYDVVFIDPPYQQPLLRPCLDWLMELGCVDERTSIYLEWSTQHEPPALPEDWDWHRQMKTREVACGIMRHDDV